MMTDDKKIWKPKEQRELFCKCVNTILMRCGEDKLPNIEPILEIAKKVTDKAFTNYPSPVDENESVEVDFPK